MPTSIEKLFEAGSEHYDLGDFDQFYNKMSNPQSQQKFYQALSSHYDLGDYDTFSGKVRGAYIPTGMEQPDQLEAQPGYEEPQPVNGGGEQPEPETPQQMVGHFVRDSVANDPFLAGMNDEIDSQLADVMTSFEPQAEQAEEPPLAPIAEEQAAEVSTEREFTPPSMAFGPYYPMGTDVKEIEARSQKRLKDMSEKSYDAPKTFISAMKDTRIEELMPFVAGAFEIQEMGNLYAASQRLKDGEATQADLIQLNDFVKSSEQEATFGGNVAEVLKMLPAFMGEFVATSGIYSAGKQAGIKAMSKGMAYLATKGAKEALKAQGAKYVEKKASIKLLEKVVGGAAGATLQTLPAAATRIPADALQRMMPDVEISKDEAGALEGLVTGEGDNAWAATAKALGNSWVEVMSEHSGGLIPAMGPQARNMAVKLGLMKAWKKANPKKSFSQFKDLVGRAGWNGFIGEMFEERVGELGRAAIGIEDYTPPTMEQLAVEMVAFAVPGVAFHVTGTALDKQKKTQYKKQMADNVRLDIRNAVREYQGKEDVDDPTKSVAQAIADWDAQQEGAVSEAAPAKEDFYGDAAAEDILGELPEEEGVAEEVPAEPVASDVAAELDKAAAEEDISTAVAAQEAAGEEITPEPTPMVAEEEIVAEAAREPEVPTERQVERRVSAREVETERRLTEQEPIMELDAEQITTVKADVARLESLQDVVERYPDDNAVDRYARQIAEKKFGKVVTPDVAKPAIEWDIPPAALRGDPPAMTYVQAKKRPDNKWRLMYRGTSNEIFPGELFNSANEARNFYKVQWVKAGEAEKVTPKVTGAEPATERVSGVIEDKNDLLFASSGNAFTNKKAAETYAKHKGEGYAAVPYGDKWAVKKPAPKPKRELTEEDKAFVEKQLDKTAAEAKVLEVKKRKENLGMSIEGPPEGVSFTSRPSATGPKTGQPGMGALKVKQALAPIEGKFNIPIRVIGGVEDVTDAKTQAAIRVENDKGSVVYAYYDKNAGEIVILGDTILNEKELLNAILPHEIAHYGIQGVLGEKGYQAFLRDLRGDPVIGPMIDKLIKDHGWKPDYAAAEWWANNAEGKDPASIPKRIWDRIIIWFKKHLRAWQVKKGWKQTKFVDAEINDLLRRGYQYATAAEVAEVRAITGEAAFKTLSLSDVVTQLAEVERAMSDLPAMRNNKSTEGVRQRLEAKSKELESRIAYWEGPQFRSRKAEGSRLEKKLRAMEASLPEKGRDELLKRRRSTLIREQIKAIKQGHLMGQRDLKEALGEVRRFVLNYARQYLPKEGITRGQVKPLLTAVANAETADDMITAYNRVDAITRTVTEKSMISDIDKLLKRYRPKKKDGKITGTTLTADEYGGLADIRDIVKMSAEDVTETKLDILRAMNSRGEQLDAKGGEETDTEAELLYRLDVFGDLRHKTVSQLRDAKDELQGIINVGRTTRKEKDKARRDAMNAYKDKTLGFITQGQGVLTEEQIAAIANSKELLSKGEKAIREAAKGEGVLRKYYQAQLTLEYALDALSRNEEGAIPLRGSLNKYFMPKVHAARNAESKGVREGLELFQGKMVEIWGTSKPKELELFGKVNAVPVPLGVTVRQNDKDVPLVLSQEQAYKKWQEWQDPTLADTFKKMGYTQETMDAIEAFIDPRVKEWAEWQLYEFYPKYYATVNAVFRARYNVDLPYNPVYTPISRFYEGSDKQDDQLLSDNTTQFSAIINNHLKGRVKNTRALKLLGGDSTLVRHLVEMEHFKAWAEPMRDFRSYFGDERIRAAIKQHFGPHLLKKIDDFINDLARGGVDPKLVVPFLDKRRKSFTTAVLGYNLTLIPKQLASIPAYAAEIPAVDWVAGLRDAAKNPGHVRSVLSKSETLIARYGTGAFDRDVMLAFQQTPQQQLAGNRPPSNAPMWSTKLGDRAAILMGGWSVYKYHYDNALNGTGPYAEKHSVAEAKDIAMYEFEMATVRTQQSGNLEDLPAIMRGGSWPRLFTMFQTATASYFRTETSALLNLKHGRGAKSTQLKRFAIAHFILPQVFQLIANAGRWRDEDQLRAAMLGSLNGLLIIGKWLETGSQAAISKIMGARSYFFGIGSNPVFESLDDVNRSFESAMKLADSDDINWKDVAKVIDGVLKVATKYTGHGYAAPARMAEGLYEAVSGRRLHPAKMVGYSDYATRESSTPKRQLLDSLEEHSEAPKDERDSREWQQLEAEAEDEIKAYNKEAHKNDEPLIKQTEINRAKRTPRQVAAGLLHDSGSRNTALSDKSVKIFHRKAKLALENGDLPQVLYDKWMTKFEKNQEDNRKFNQGYYEQGLEAPTRSSQSPSSGPPSAPKPPRPPTRRALTR